VDRPDTPPETSAARPMAEAETFRLSIGTTLSDIGRVIDLLEAELTIRHVPPDLLQKAQTVADELVTNVIRHGCRDGRPREIDVAVAVRPGELVLQLSDDGIPFSPCDGPAPDPIRPLLERRSGGLGIPLVRRLAAECRYARVDGRNQVTVVLKHPAS
jgi:anti-sigma regulatory factor (Ser/Thr protein kinase)